VGAVGRREVVGGGLLECCLSFGENDGVEWEMM
jgi:hypothetical protein